MRRFTLPLAIVAVLALTLAAAAGCGSSSGGSSGGSSQPSAASTNHTPVTLTVWHPWTVSSEKKGFQRAVAGFHTQYPWITLHIVSFPDSTTFDQQVIKAVEAGGGPDVAITFSPDTVGQYAHDGLLVDLNPYLQRDHLSTGTFAPASLTYTQFEGKRVVLPVLTDAYGLYYNKDMFAKYGIAVPTTMDEFVAALQKFKDNGITPMAESAAEYPLGQLWYQLALTKANRSWVNDYQLYTGNVDWHAPELSYATQTVSDWVNKGYISKDATGLKAEDAGTAFEAGKYPLFFSGSWWYNRFTTEIKNYQWGTFLFPAKMSPGSAGNMWVVPTSAKNKDLAYKFIDITMSPKIQALMGNNGGIPVAANASDITDPRSKELIDNFTI